MKLLEFLIIKKLIKLFNDKNLLNKYETHYEIIRALLQFSKKK